MGPASTFFQPVPHDFEKSQHCLIVCIVTLDEDWLWKSGRHALACLLSLPWLESLVLVIWCCRDGSC